MIPLKDDNPTRGVPVVTYALLGACVLVFLWQLSLGEREIRVAVYALGLTPAVLFGSETLPAEAQWVPATATIFTSMFPHGGFGHLIGNMLYLWIFGDNVEDSMGSGRFVLFYFVCGIAAALAQAVPAPDSVIPMIGASGAVSGVLGAYMLMYPRAHVLVLVPIPFMVYLARIPALFVLALWFGIQLLSSIAAPEGAGVAFRAHVGGFVAGALLIYLFRPRKARRED